MTRQKYKHLITPGLPHGLTFSCYQNRRFLVYPDNRKSLIDAINNARIRYYFDVWAYVFMPEHVHIVIFPKQSEYSISKILRAIKQPVSRKAIRYLKGNQPGLLRLMETREKHHPYRFWQDGGGYDRNIRDTDELERFLKYIHDNPVRRGLVENSSDWIWSSASFWLKEERGPLRIDIESFPRS